MFITSLISYYTYVYVQCTHFSFFTNIHTIHLSMLLLRLTQFFQISISVIFKLKLKSPLKERRLQVVNDIKDNTTGKRW